MKKLFIVLLILITTVILVGCNGAESQVLPTLIPTLEDTEVPSPTAEMLSVPTATPIDFDRATLPPTWTVSPIPSLTYTPTFDATAQAQSVKPTLVVCGGFAVDRERSPTNYDRVLPVTVYWTAVSTAARYRLTLYSDTGTELFTDLVTDTSYTFEPDTFDGRLRYAWEVYPEDGLNQQMCFQRGGDLLPPP